MTKNLRFFLLAAAAMLVVLPLSACNNSEPAAETVTPASAPLAGQPGDNNKAGATEATNPRSKSGPVGAPK